MTVVIATLVAMYLVSLVLDYGFGLRRQGGFRWLASLDMEQNPQAWYQALSLFGCAVLLVVCGAVARYQGERRWRYWFSFAALFAFLSLDEISALHERVSEPLRRLVNGHGVFYFAWVLGWAAVLLVVAVTHLRWFLTLPRATRLRFVVAGALYVAGAVGFEMLEGRMYSGDADVHRLAYELLVLGEESLEMLGIFAFTRALLLHLGAAAGTVELRLTGDARQDRGPAQVAPTMATSADGAVRGNGRPTRAIATR